MKKAHLIKVIDSVYSETYLLSKQLMELSPIFKKVVRVFSLVLVGLLTSFVATAQLVNNPSELQQAIEAAKPGNVITMANGTWENTEILFEASGTSDEHITLKAEEKGKVILTGKSNLRIAGKYLLVEGLVFQNGFSPTSEVISFKKDSKTLANNCRLTQVVIDNFNGPERYDVQAWTVLYGKNNRVDHCSFINKRTQGVTLIVRLNAPESVENNHQIDHNYFGPRQNLGSNGGETLRIGTSHFSMMNSKSIVEYNYFDRCDGEIEIISNKSGQNTYRYNTFFESKGTLTIRHGNETHVEGNVLIGNGIANTGGIRVINEKQTVINNYLEGLTGNRFRGALTIMNGVPNSPLNRYVPVKESKVLNNTVINCDHIELCAGSDSERSAIPSSTSFSNNIISSKSSDIFGIFDDISGIDFSNNLISPEVKKPTEKGFETKKVAFERAKNGLLVPKNETSNTGANITHNFANKTNTGANWYKSKTVDVAFSSGKVIPVSIGLNSLQEAIENSAPGDILLLESSKVYHTSKNILIHHPLTIRSNGDEKANLLFETKYLFKIENGGSLKLEGLSIDGEEAPDGPLNAVIATSKYSMNKNYKLIVDNCDFQNLDVNNFFNVLYVAPSTFADSIAFTNSTFSTISGDVLALNKETDDIGIYNAEAVIIENCSFKDVKGSAINMYRGGRDESTTAGILTVDKSLFENVGLKKGAINLLGVQVADIKNCVFKNTGAFNINLTVGEPHNMIHNCVIEKTQEINITGEGYSSSNLKFN
ncbi:polysaccharide lyase 6 family protein [uncultured Arcticibacterium sp.]|uniref:polysaccharide lyase 6 family protein n=1 Tax=uncultured Arcticibacterium sp. TaxID=2173042 RepID=UPI0030F92A94